MSEVPDTFGEGPVTRYDATRLFVPGSGGLRVACVKVRVLLESWGV